MSKHPRGTFHRRPRTAVTVAVASEGLAVTIEHVPIGVGHAAPNGSWLFVNRRFCEFLGVTAEELLNASGAPPIDPSAAGGLAAMLAGEVDHYAREQRYNRPDGSPVWVKENVWLIRSDEGTPEYLLVATEDVSENRHLKEQVEHLQTRLVRKSELIDLSLDAIFAWDLATNKIIYWSKGAERTYGWSRSEAEGMVASRLLDTQFPQSVASILDTLNNTGAWEGDLVHTTKDGKRITVASRWGLQQDGNSTDLPSAVLEVNRDVTAERHLVAQCLALAKEQQRIAEVLQRSLLMTPPPEIYPGLSVKPIYQGAQEDVLVGGDFFDVFAVSKNRVALVVGDATGKGLEAATYTAELKFALRAYLREHQHPGLALCRLNTFVADKERLDAMHFGVSYAAVAVAVVNTDVGSIEVASAGAERPIILRTTGEVIEINAGGPLLGAASEAAFDGFQGHLDDGDVLVMVTDGLTEAREPTERAFLGPGGLVAILQRELPRSLSLADAGIAVVDRVRDFAGGALHDDVCLLLARRSHAAG